MATSPLLGEYSCSFFDELNEANEVFVRPPTSSRLAQSCWLCHMLARSTFVSTYITPRVVIQPSVWEQTQSRIPYIETKSEALEVVSEELTKVCTNIDICPSEVSSSPLARSVRIRDVEGLRSSCSAAAFVVHNTHAALAEKIRNIVPPRGEKTQVSVGEILAARFESAVMMIPGSKTDVGKLSRYAAAYRALSNALSIAEGVLLSAASETPRESCPDEARRFSATASAFLADVVVKWIMEDTWSLVHARLHRGDAN